MRNTLSEYFRAHRSLTFTTGLCGLVFASVAFFLGVGLFAFTTDRKFGSENLLRDQSISVAFILAGIVASYGNACLVGILLPIRPVWRLVLSGAAMLIGALVVSFIVSGGWWLI